VQKDLTPLTPDIIPRKRLRILLHTPTKGKFTIIPEIEMPGHASAAIAAYPWLGTIGDLNEVPTVFGKLPDSFNVSDPRVYEFLENVLLEVMELFPGNNNPYWRG